MYGSAGLQDLRFTKIYTTTHKIYGLLQAPCLVVPDPAEYCVGLKRKLIRSYVT